jgi:hypothetical protein
MAKTVAKVGRNGGSKKGGGGEAQEEATALAGTLKEVVAPVEEVTAADTHISGSAKGVAAGTIAVASTVDNQPVNKVDSTQVQVGVDPS